MNQWPPHSTIVCRDADQKVLARSSRSRLDLSDSLMHGDIDEIVECTIDVSVAAEPWTTWKRENVEKIERHIAYDLNFDAYEVQITRVSTPGRTLCSKPFTWSLKIWVDCGDDESTIVRRAIGKRFKAANSNASVKTIQAKIESVFGLPRGSVCLLDPSGKKSAERGRIRGLREKWKRAD